MEPKAGEDLATVPRIRERAGRKRPPGIPGQAPGSMRGPALQTVRAGFQAVTLAAISCRPGEESHGPTAPGRRTGRELHRDRAGAGHLYELDRGPHRNGLHTIIRHCRRERKPLKETIDRVIEVNIADATALIKILEKDGDPEALQRARADLAKWEAMKKGRVKESTASPVGL